MDYAALVGVVVGFPVKLVCEFFPRPVSGGGNGGFALAAGYDFDAAMIDCYDCSPFCGSFPRPFVPRGTKRRLQDRTYHIHVVYKCALAKSKGRGASPLSLHCALVLVLVCTILLHCIGGFGEQIMNANGNLLLYML